MAGKLRYLSRTQIIDQIDFFTRYNVTTAVFGSMSYCCVTRTAFERIGAQPFSTDLHAVEDSYLCYRLALLGPVAFTPVTVVAYRLTEDSLSVNRVRILGLWVQAFERLESAYRNSGSPTLFNRFQFFYASKRREFAKVLLGVGDVRSARLQLKRSLSNCHNPDSLLKSSGLLMLSYLPTAMQPKWPAPSVRLQLRNERSVPLSSAKHQRKIGPDAATRFYRRLQGINETNTLCNGL